MTIVLWVLLGVIVGWLSCAEYQFYKRAGTLGVSIWTFANAPAEVRACFPADQKPSAWVVRVPGRLVDMDDWAWVKNVAPSFERRVLVNGDVLLLGQ